MSNQDKNKTIWEFFKLYGKHGVILIIGIIIGICLQIPRFYIGEKDVLIKTDTIIREVVKTYSKLDLQKNTIKINVPKFNIRDFVFIKVDSLIIKDSIKYVHIPREHYYTKKDDIEIGHSGIDSQIDSLRYKVRETTVTETYKRRDGKHEIDIYGNVGYCNGLQVPIGVQYTYYPKRGIGVGAKMEYDFITNTTGIYAKADIRFGG